jgi:lipoprotein-releasing system permease protein
MRLLVLVAIVACSNTRPAASPEAVGSAKAVNDPWNVPADPQQAGSAEPIPKWANDPPTVLRDKINAVNAHVDILKSTATFPEYRDVLAMAEHTAGVAAAEPFIFTELVIAKPGKPGLGIAIKAVDPSRVGHVLAVGNHMKEGTLDTLGAKGEPPPMVMGDDLARKLDVRVGEIVTVTVHDDDHMIRFEPTSFRVSGLFHLDFDEYDERLALVPLVVMQKMVGRGDQVMGIEMTVKDPARSDEIAKALQKQLGGPPYQAMDWYELNSKLFHAMYGDRRP